MDIVTGVTNNYNKSRHDKGASRWVVFGSAIVPSKAPQVNSLAP